MLGVNRGGAALWPTDAGIRLVGGPCGVVEGLWERDHGVRGVVADLVVAVMSKLKSLSSVY